VWCKQHLLTLLLHTPFPARICVCVCAHASACTCAKEKEQERERAREGESMCVSGVDSVCFVRRYVQTYKIDLFV